MSFRHNQNLRVLESLSRTATNNSGDLRNQDHKGIHVVLDVTDHGTGEIVLTIQGKDQVSGKYYTLLAGAAVTTTSTNVYKVYPDLTATTNVSANDIVPETFRILITHNNANAMTYSVGASLVG